MKTVSATLLSVLLPVLLLSAAGGAYAADRWYNVEVIIFAHNDEAALWEEYWPQDPGAPDNSDAVSLVANIGELERLPGQLIEFEELPISMLVDSLARLQRSGRYRVIYATAWRLPGLPRQLAPSVRIRAGRMFNAWGEPIPQDSAAGGTIGTGAVPGPAGAASGGAAALPADVLHEIDGRIKISLSKYLDVDADLLYRDNVQLTDADGLAVQSLYAFRLSEHRSMKRNTIHYLDHPLFGVLIGVDRYAPQASGQPSNQPNNPPSGGAGG